MDTPEVLHEAGAWLPDAGRYAMGIVSATLLFGLTAVFKRLWHRSPATMTPEAQRVLRALRDASVPGTEGEPVGAYLVGDKKAEYVRAGHLAVCTRRVGNDAITVAGRSVGYLFTKAEQKAIRDAARALFAECREYEDGENRRLDRGHIADAID